MRKNDIRLTEEEYNKLKEDREPFLTQSEFWGWVENHFHNLDRRVTYIAGGLAIVIPLIIAIFIKLFCS